MLLNPSITISVVLLILMIKFFKISPLSLNHWQTFSIKPWKNLNVTLTTHYYCLFSKHWANLTPHCAYVKTHGCLPDLQMRTSLEGLASKNKQTNKQQQKTYIYIYMHWTDICTHEGLLMTSFNVLSKSLDDIVSKSNLTAVPFAFIRAILSAWSANKGVPTIGIPW